MAVKYEVATVFSAQDHASGAIRKLSHGLAGVGKTGTRAFNDISIAANKFRGAITSGTFKAGLLQKGMERLSQGVSAVGNEFILFDDAIISAAAKFKDVNPLVEEGRQKIDALRMAARRTGADTEFSAGKAAEGLDFLAMAGFNAQQAMAALPGTVDLATNAKIDLARATDIVSDSLGAFGLMTTDSAQLTKNLTRVNDVSALTMARTNTSLEDLFEAAKKGAPTFTAAQQPIETFNALIGIMASNSVKGEEAGTQLRNVILQLASPTKEAQKVLDSLGVTVADKNNNFRDVVDILGDFEQGLKAVGTQERAAALSTVFGKRAITGINILLQEGVENVRAFRGELENSGGAAERMAKFMRSALGPQLKAVSSAFIELGLDVLMRFRGDIVAGLEAVRSGIKNFDVAPLIRSLKTALTIFRGIWTVAKPLLPVLSIFVSYLVAKTIVTKGFMALNFVRYLFGFARAIKSAAAAQRLFNIALSLNPIGLVITAVTVLVYGIIKLIQHWDKVKGFFGKFFGKYERFSAGLKARGKGEPIIGAEIESAEKLGAKRWSKVKAAFAPGKPVERIGTVGKFPVARVMRTPLIGAPKKAEETPKAWKAISKLFSGAEPTPLEPAKLPEERSELETTPAPNREKIAALSGRVEFDGRLQVAGAPPGSTLTGETRGAPPIKLDLLGENT